MDIEKRDYTQTKSTYRSLVEKKSLNKLQVSTDDMRSRAELLDAIEDFFRGGAKSITPEKDRALMSMIVLSAYNAIDDSIDANAIDWSSIPTSKPRDAGKVYVDRGTVKIS